MKYLLAILGASLLLSATPENTEEQVIIRNRILAKVQGKTLSVLDVVKKMDVYLNTYYPDMANSPVARYQFYVNQWRDTLQQMIDHELILADAEEKEVKVTDAEVREQLVERFGPNIMPILEKLGISYVEARQMVFSDILVEKMTWFRVNNKVIQKIYPQDIKNAYQERLGTQGSLDEWKYQVLALRSNDTALAKRLVDKTKEFSVKDLTELSELLKKELSPEEEATITLSQDLTIDGKNLSAAHREILLALQPGSISPPFSQVSRTDGTQVWRIFHLKEFHKKSPPPFEVLAEELRNELIQQALAQETASYISRLRQHFGYQQSTLREMVPADFQPFALAE